MALDTFFFGRKANKSISLSNIEKKFLNEK